MSLNDVLTIALAFLIMAVMGLGLAYIYLTYKNKQKENKIEDSKEKSKGKAKGSSYTKLSVFDFMQFDKVEDNMIVQDDGARYLMVIECEGVNYDLMSDLEKAAVEAGFVQFLNTLRFTVQIYTQTRTVNIEESILNYRTRVDEISRQLESKKRTHTALLQSGTATNKQIEDSQIELNRLQNMHDYGTDVINNIEKTSKNKNVLKKHYYIIVPYLSSEIDNDLLDIEEKRNMIFSELYTRAQSIMRTLYACSMKCKILNSYEIADLLYIAYNRDEAETYGIDRALRAGYTELYSTAPDAIDKKMEALNKKIEEDGLKLAIDTIEKVKSEKAKRLAKKEKSFDELVLEMAKELLKDNKKIIGKEMADEALERLEHTNEEGGSKDEEKPKKRIRKSTK